jgi:hypothetical protein
LFGAEYERYRDRTSFIIPGDRYLRGKFPPLKLPAFVQVAGAFVVTLAACFGLMWLITTVKVAFQSVPFTIATVIFAPEVKQAPAMTARTVKGVPFVQAGRVAVVRGPYRNATAAGFAERVLQRLRQSAALKDFLAFLDEPAGDALVVFCAPFEKPDQPGTPGMRAGGAAGGRGPAPDPAGPDRVRLVMMRCALAPGASLDDVFAVKSKRQIRAGCIAPVNLGSPEGSDIVEGEVTRPGPKFPGEERWGFLLKQLAAQPATALPVVVPGQAASATLVLVHAPILRTRRDPEFTREIFDRLTASAKFRDRLRQSGAGGNVVAVAFPRPGPNWYREHHGQPQLSVFVMLVRHRGGELFRDRGHEFLGAFIAEMDFKITPPADCVGEVTLIGPRRDLAERWRFFLSGVR